MPDPKIQLSELLDTAHRVGERAAREAVTMEKNSRISDELMADMVHGNLVNILQPKRFGGLELGFPAFVRVGEVLSSYNVSAGWVQCLLGIHHYWGALLNSQLQEELWGDDPHRMFADVFAPVGKVEIVEDGYLLSGEWKFASGVLWSDFVALGAMVPGAGPGGEPEYRMFFVPKGEFEILDDWDTLGLKGTASCGIRVEKAFVPTYRTMEAATVFAHTAPAPGIEYNPGPLYKIPFGAALAIAIVTPSLGGVTGILKSFHERMRSRVPLFTDESQNDMVTSQVLLAESSVRVEAIRLLLYRYADELMEVGEKLNANPGEDVMEFRARVTGWRVHIGREARSVGEELFEHSGAFAVYGGNDVQRFWRDLYTMASHIGIQHEVGLRNYGRNLVGLEPIGGIV